MTPKAILDLGWGDAGKGRVVDELCRTSGGVPKVVRFNGGHQAAHHVVLENGLEHVFAHFGSGTFRGAPTYWTKYCPVSPTALLNEYRELDAKAASVGCRPVLYIDREAPLTTPWERRWNRKLEASKIHGTCGVGIHATVRREEVGHHIWFEDIYHPAVLRDKVRLLENHYPSVLYDDIERGSTRKELDAEVDRFLEDCERLAPMDNIRLGESTREFEAFPTNVPVQMIFEGAQGLMLDSKFGFYPHVTPSRTGTHNLMDMHRFNLDLYLVTRAYATRHGAGPFVPFEGELKLKPNPWERNGDDGMQGKFRTGPLSLDHLRYAVNKDPYIREHKQDATLVVTCVDQLSEGAYTVSENGKIRAFDEKVDMLKVIAKAVDVNKAVFSNRAFGDLNPFM